MTSRVRKSRAARLSVFSNSLLVALKLAVGLFTGSVAVLSEGLHSATDLVASLIAFAAVRVSDAPPDEDHPFGHGKIESVSGLAEAMLILVGALYIIYESIHKLMAATPAPRALPLAMGVMAISVVANLAISRYLARVARETDSLALLADAEHLRTDVITSLGVLGGLALVHFTGRGWLDPAAGLIVAVLILHAAGRLARESLFPLLDTRLPQAEEDQIRRVLDDDARVLGYHKLRTRKAGSERHVDLHLQIEDETTLVQAHAVTEELEDRIREVLPGINITIHVEPYRAEMNHQWEEHGLQPHEVNQKVPPPR